MQNSLVGRGIPKNGGGGFAALFDEDVRRSGGFLGLLRVTWISRIRVRSQLVKPGQVLLSYVVVRRYFAGLVQHGPRVKVAAQLDQCFHQAVHRLNIVGEQLQDGLVNFCGAFPFALQSKVHSLATEVSFQLHTARCAYSFRIHPVSCPVLHPRLPTPNQGLHPRGTNPDNPRIPAGLPLSVGNK